MSGKTSALRGFHFDQPFMGFTTKLRSISRKGKKTSRVVNVDQGADCREELIWDTREYFQRDAARLDAMPGTWRSKSTLLRTLDMNHRDLKQPGVTYFWFGDPDGYGKSALCMKPCCLLSFPELMDAVVGPVAVALNPDRYVGDWWMTLPEEIHPKNSSAVGDELRWYGTDNFFLRHPVLISIMMGMFRQGILLHEQGFTDAILKKVKRKDVEECLSNGDPKLAMRLLTTLRPWLEATQWTANFAFPKGKWARLGQLQRAIYKHGYDTVFEASLEQSWNLVDAEEGRYQICKGPTEYWGAKKATEAGKRLAKLGK